MTRDHTAGQLGARLGLILLCVAALGPARAAERREDSGQEALRRAQYMLRDLSTQLEASKAENQKLQDQTDKLKAKVTDLEKYRKQGDIKLQKLAGYNAGLADRLHQYQIRMQEFVAQHRKTLETLRDTTTQRDGLKAILARQVKQIDYCEAANQKLYQAGTELIRRYRNKGVWDALLQREPVTGLKEVALEKILQRYRARIDRAHLDGAKTASN